MKICFFGSYDKNYPKNVTLLLGLKQKKVKIYHCHHPNYFSFHHYPSLFKQYYQKARDCDVIYVAFFGHYDVWAAWIVGKIFRKPVIFDPLISVYNTRIEDRGYFKKNSIRAKLYILFDKINTKLADRVLIDTYEHFKYFNKMFGLPEKKTSILRVGASVGDQKINTKLLSSNNFNILFYGSYQPSQGVVKIIKAAKVLKNKDINWILVGTGIDRVKVEQFAIRNKLEKVTFLENMPFDSLLTYINKASVVMGAFGNTVKTRMVIHNKIFQGVAMGKTVLTQDTKAVREIFRDNYDVILSPAKPSIIAKKLLQLFKNPEFNREIAKNAKHTFLSQFNSIKIAEQLMAAVKVTMKHA